MDLQGKVAATGKAYAEGTDDNGWWIGSDGHRYRDIRPGDHAWELQKAFEPLVNKILIDNSPFRHVHCCRCISDNSFTIWEDSHLPLAVFRYYSIFLCP